MKVVRQFGFAVPTTYSVLELAFLHFGKHPRAYSVTVEQLVWAMRATWIAKLRVSEAPHVDPTRRDPWEVVVRTRECPNREAALVQLSGLLEELAGTNPNVGRPGGELAGEQGNANGNVGRPGGS